ncbi:MAG: helix-turn-helix domain-containing protein [Candidatus Babeliales bacterium]|nr:helix-turn-helix domain-containing protein [Candidatus Babeliales bacterium]MDR3667992.1 helix-turn-helix domain-containing protein [Ignavibacteriaceae bacterium]
MTRAVSKEVREKIIRSYELGVGTIDEIAIIFEIHPRTVAKYLQIYRDGGDLSPKPHTGRPPILTKDKLAIIKSIVMSNKDGTLQNYADAFKEITGIEVTYVTIHYACEKLNIRRKKRVSTLKNKID